MIPKTIEMKNLNKELQKISQALINSVDELPEGITRELAIGANDIRNTIITSMRDTPKTGRHYRRGKEGKVHIASSPGNAPAIDYGELVRSITFDVREMEIEVGSAGGAPYVIFLEPDIESSLDDVYGGNFNPFSGSLMRKIEPRPSIGPAVAKHKQEIIDKVGESAFEVIKKGFE